MGVRRAQHVAESHAGQHDVAHIAAAAPEQAWILEPGHALADRKFTHRISSGLSSAEKMSLVLAPSGGSVGRHDVGVFGELHRRADIVLEEAFELLDAHRLRLDPQLW